MDAYLAASGFRPKLDHSDYVTYRRSRCFVQFHYWVEDAPAYSPMVAVGLVPWPWQRLGLSEIGLWYAIPKGAEEALYETWRFSSAAQLVEVLTRIREQVLEPYGRPLWRDTGHLAELIAKREREWRTSGS